MPDGSDLQDLPRHEQVLRTVEEGKRGALALRRQGTAFGELGAPLDVARRQRAQGARDLTHGEVGQVALLERLEPAGDQWIHGHETKVTPEGDSLPVTC